MNDYDAGPSSLSQVDDNDAADDRSFVFDPLPESGYPERSSQETSVLDRYISRPTPQDPILQLSRPQPSSVYVPAQEPPPPVSMGFGSFLRRFKEIDARGLVDGSGIWPDTPPRSPSHTVLVEHDPFQEKVAVMTVMIPGPTADTSAYSH